MWKETYKVVDVRQLAKKIHALQNIDDELSFATVYETDEDGAVLEKSTGDWFGVKFTGAFDGTYLLIGGWGGGRWYAYDATHDLVIEKLEEILERVFKDIVAKNVCMEEVTLV